LCSFFESEASMKGKKEIDEELTQAYLIRKNHRERTGQPYYDMSFFTSSRLFFIFSHSFSLPFIIELN